MRLYKILPTALWQTRSKTLPHAPLDERDGYIHLSTGAQLRETAEKHFAEQSHLSLIVIDSEALDQKGLRWEPSRGGALFPHVYGALPLTAVIEATELVGDEVGKFAFPAADE